MTSRVKVLYPYLLHSTWVFDDQATGLKEEAFVLGMTQIISRLVTEKGIDNASAGFALHFSDEPFPDGDVVMQAGAPDMGGTWYSGQVMGEQMEGWLCPALFLYFATAPDRLYVKAEPLPAGVNPIWDPKDAFTRQFMAPSM
jgi:hypothetical protein